MAYSFWNIIDYFQHYSDCISQNSLFSIPPKLPSISPMHISNVQWSAIVTRALHSACSLGTLSDGIEYEEWSDEFPTALIVSIQLTDWDWVWTDRMAYRGRKSSKMRTISITIYLFVFPFSIVSREINRSHSFAWTLRLFSLQDNSRKIVSIHSHDLQVFTGMQKVRCYLLHCFCIIHRALQSSTYG